MLHVLVGCCRNLLDSYYLGRVIGAGSFGVVREGIKVATGKRFAVKTVSKVPKRGAPTPRCVSGGCGPQHILHPGGRLAIASHVARGCEQCRGWQGAFACGHQSACTRRAGGAGRQLELIDSTLSARRSRAVGSVQRNRTCLQAAPAHLDTALTHALVCGSPGTC